MENQEASNLLLKKKYNLHNSPEVKEAAKRTQIRTGEKVPQDPLANIQNYLNRFHEITDRKDPNDREHGLDAAKRFLHSKFVIKPQEIPESYFENQQRMAREMGHGDIDISHDVRHELAEVIIADQRSSLDKWVDYLTSADAPYSDGLKYFALRSVLSMGEYDKEKHAFGQRSKGTVKPFPDLNREALAYALDTIDKKYKQSFSTNKGQSVDIAELGDKDAQEFEKLIQGENFAKLYAWAIDKVTPASVEQLLNTRGQWVKYNQNSDSTALVESLQGHGTGWCTAAESTAEAQLRGGDFYVYYSIDQTGKPTVPRAAIRMQDNSIVEIRGVAPEQNLDPYMGEVVEEKLKEFPDGKVYQKKAADMKRLTALERKQAAGQDLTSDDLNFLYEVDSQIEGFGFQKDPRIDQLQKTRDKEVDMPVIFDCTSAQIAHKSGEIDKNTRAYVGPLEKGIFKKLQDNNIEHVYTAFPESRIRRDDVLLEVKTEEQYEQELTQDGTNITTYALSMMRNPDFMTIKESRQLDLVRLRVRDLGLKKSYLTTTEVFKRAEELGLDLCPPETGPQYRIKYKNQPTDEWFYIGMKPLTDSDGYPRVFSLVHRGDGLWLLAYWTKPDNDWYPSNEFVFSLRK